MTKIKFSNVRIFDPAQNRNALEGRFTAFLRELCVSACNFAPLGRGIGMQF